MLCSKCYKSILQGAEIQINGTIFCKECSLLAEKLKKEEIIARCWNCNRSIHKGELSHENFRNRSQSWVIWFSIDHGSSEKLFQCDECYREWRKKTIEKEKWPRIRMLLFGICSGLFLSIMLKIFFPEVSKRFDDNTPLIYVLLFLVWVMILVLRPVLDVDIYRFKRVPKKQNNKFKKNSFNKKSSDLLAKRELKGDEDEQDKM